MRVIILDTKPVRRGAQIFIQSLANYFRQQNLETSVIYLYQADQSTSLELDSSDKNFSYSDQNILEKILSLQPLLLLNLIFHLRKLKPDILLLNGSRNLKYGAASSWFLSRRTKLIYRSIDSALFWNPGGIRKWYYARIVMPTMDGVIAVSRASLQDTVKHYGFKVPCTFIHRSVDFAKMNLNQTDHSTIRSSSGRNPFTIIFVGSLTAQKRPDIFIQVIHRLRQKKSEISAVMVGEGPMREKVQSDILKFDLADCVRLVGSHADVFPWLQQADLLLLTSDTEGLPGVILEAAMVGVPSVAPAVGGVEECIENGVSGIVVPVNQPELLESAILQLSSDQVLLRNMGAAARIKVIREFSLDAAGFKYIEFFHKILSNSVSA